jgi:steroid delta-isomerase-like uncharacterized protein
LRLQRQPLLAKRETACDSGESNQRLQLTLPPFGDRPWAVLPSEFILYGEIVLTSFLRMTPRFGGAMDHQPTRRTSHKGDAMPAANLRFALLYLLVIMLPACSQEPRSSVTSNPDAFASELLEAWDSHDIDRILTYYTDDAFYEDVPNVENGWAVPMRGHQMIRESLVATFEEMPDLGFDFVSASGVGDRMVVEWIMTGTHYRDFSGSFSIRGVSVIKLKGDKIASVSDYYDAYLLLSQLGIVPALDEGQSTTSGDSVTR